MIKMSPQIENIVAAYKTLSKIPSVLGGKLIKTSGPSSKITSRWSTRNLDKGKNTKFLYNYVLDESLKVIAESEFGIDINNEILSAVSPQETFKAVIREEKDSKDAKKQYLEVWQRNNLVHSIDLTALDIHGDVYTDSEFGSLGWSQDEGSVVYVAEKKVPKSEPYIKRKGEDKPKNDGSGETAIKKGEEYIYRQDWGEQLVGKYLSVVVVCQLQTETCTILKGLPEGWCPGQVHFSPDGRSVVGVAWETVPTRLGLIFCTNRPSYIFRLTLDGNMEKLSSEGLAVRSPRLSPRGDLFWLQRSVGGPHHACHSLVTFKQGETEVKTVIDIVQNDLKIVGGESFYGVYCQALPERSFSTDGQRILFSTPQQNEIRSYVADIDGSRIVDISFKGFPGSTSLVDVSNDLLLASVSNLTTPTQLYIARLPTAGSESTIKWVRVSTPGESPVSPNSQVEYLALAHDNSDDVKSFSAIYFAPKSDKKLPLIVWPHGGPHSGFVNAFSLEAALYNLLGFAILQVNYRGSVGSGESSVTFLPKRVGDADVLDCKYATQVAIERFRIDETRVGLTGGSHGGFLVVHLSGQYPDLYKVVVTRNPVIDLSSVATVRVNYRGSTGFGDANVRSLLGKVGDYDVNDCHLALTTLLERDDRIDKDNLLLYGGSFGGFVVAHLAAMYPELFRAVVMRNPLIDLATKGQSADNLDGCDVEAGFEYTEEGPVSEERLLAMRRCSPLTHAHRIRAAVCLLLGSVDKRVPCSQGKALARRIARNVPLRVYMYEDNHSLSSLPVEMDHLINGTDWMLQYLKP